MLPLLLMGGTAPWGRPLAAGVALVATGLAGHWIRRAASPERLPVPPVPLAIGLAGVALVALFQLLPLPFPLLSAVSPQAAEVWTAAPGSPAWRTLSLAPHATGNAALLWWSAAMLHLAVALWTSRTGRAGVALGALAGAATILITLSALERTVGLSVWNRHLHLPSEGFGPFPNRNDLAVLAASAAPLATALFASGARRLRELAVGPGDMRIATVTGWAVAAAFLVAVTVGSGSRIGLAAAVAGMTTALAVSAGAPSPRGRRFGLLAAVAASGAAAWVGAGGGMPLLGGLGNEGSVRVELARRSLAVFTDHPGAGVGLGALDAVLPLYGSSRSLGGHPGHVENDVLEMLAETGIIGFGVLAAGAFLWCCSVVRAARSGVGEGRGPDSVGRSERAGRRPSSERKDSTLAAGVLGGAAALLAGSLGTFVLPVPALLLWFAALTGVGSGMAPSPHGSRTRIPRLARSHSWPAAGLVLVGSTVLVPLAIARFHGGWTVRSAHPDGTSRAALLLAVRFDGRNPRLALGLARSYQQEALQSPHPGVDRRAPLAEAMRWYGRRLDALPTDAYARIALSVLLETAARAGGTDAARQQIRAEELRQAAHRMEPYDPESS